MDTLIKADIFFFIASIATIVLAILISIVLYYFIKAGRNLYKLTEALQNGMKDSEEYVIELKERLDRNPLFRLFFPLLRDGGQYIKKNIKKL